MPRLGRWSPLLPSLLFPSQEKDDGGLEGIGCRREKEERGRRKNEGRMTESEKGKGRRREDICSLQRREEVQA